VFAFLAGKGTPRHVTFDLARPLEPWEALRVHGALLAEPGVVVARVVATAGVVHVGWRAGGSTPAVLAARLAELGFPVRATHEDPPVPTAPRDACC